MSNDNAGEVTPYREDVGETLARKTQQLAALLAVTYGGQGEEFRMLNGSIQDSFMWLAADLAEEIESLAARVVLAV